MGIEASELNPTLDGGMASLSVKAGWRHDRGFPRPRRHADVRPMVGSIVRVPFNFNLAMAND